MTGESAPARDAGLALAEQMIEAHGGAALWNRLQAVQIRVAFGGTGFRMKLLNVPVRGNLTGPFPTGARGAAGPSLPLKNVHGAELANMARLATTSRRQATPR